MAEEVVAGGRMFSYDRDNDILFLKLKDEDKVTSHQFQDWLNIRVDDSGEPVDVTVYGFANILARLVVYSAKQKIKGHAPHPVPVKFDYKKESDDFWIILTTDEELVQGPLLEDMILYKGARSGVVKALRVPQFKSKWITLIAKWLEPFIDDVMAVTQTARTKKPAQVSHTTKQVGPKTAFRQMLSQVDFDRVKMKMKERGLQLA